MIGQWPSLVNLMAGGLLAAVEPRIELELGGVPNDGRLPRSAAWREGVDSRPMQQWPHQPSSVPWASSAAALILTTVSFAVAFVAMTTRRATFDSPKPELDRATPVRLTPPSPPSPPSRVEPLPRRTPVERFPRVKTDE